MYSNGFLPEWNVITMFPGFKKKKIMINGTIFEHDYIVICVTSNWS